MKMKIWNLLSFKECLVYVVEFWITLVKMRPLEISCPQDSSIVVSTITGGRQRNYATLLVYTFLYLCSNQIVADMSTISDGDHSVTNSLVSV